MDLSSRMKKIYRVLIGLFITEIIMAFICGPHSCEWGNQVYFYFGVFCLIGSFLSPFLQKGWLFDKRLGYGFLFAIVSVIIWIGGFMVGGFRIMCKLF